MDGDMQFFYIKKGELFLAESKNITEEFEFDDFSDIGANSVTQFKWVKDADDAKVYTTYFEADSFIGSKRGAFWRDAEVVQKIVRRY